MNKQIILISGASDGLGKAIAAKLTPNYQVVILARNLEKLEKVSDEIHADFVQADVTNYESLNTAVGHVVSKFSRIDVLINCAGTWIEGQLDENDPVKIKEVIDVNTLGTIFLTKAVLPTMKSQKSGRIINIVSLDGVISKKDRTVYSASKWAITGFTKCLQEDLLNQNISVTAINPGLLKTNLFEKQGVDRNLTNALDPQEVAGLVEFVINLTPQTVLPEISIKNINNPSNMDDTNNPQIGLDINPDLITPQSGIPQAVPSGTPLNTAPITPGVIDITPGGAGGSHDAKTVDITPTGEPPAEIISETPVAPLVAPATPVVDTPLPDVPASTTNASPLTEISPAAPTVVTPEVTPVVASPLDDTAGSSGHLAEIIPNSALPVQAVVETAVTEMAPVVSAPMPDNSVTPTFAPVLTPTTESVVPVAPIEPAASPVAENTTQVQLPPVVENPLSEDPDTVKLVK